jgi:hypothetical protein
VNDLTANVLTFCQDVTGQEPTPWQKWLIELAFADADQSKIWAPLPVAAVRGDVIRMPGKEGSERTVTGVSPVIPWHVHPAANPYRPNEKRTEWSEVKVRFAGIEQPLSFTDPAFALEIETTQTELDAVALLGGWGARV